ncbi:hypothetical protein CEXT_1561, partial [Caerostris extrusa]
FGAFDFKRPEVVSIIELFSRMLPWTFNPGVFNTTLDDETFREPSLSGYGNLLCFTERKAPFTVEATTIP